jgi:hypothetical protein
MLHHAQWNSIIEYLSNNYMVLVMMSMINIYSLKLSADFLLVERFNSSFALICLFVLISFPLGMSLIYCRSIKSRRQVRKLPEPKQKAYILKIDTQRLGRRMTAVTVFVTIWHKMVIALVIMLFLD